MYAVSAAAELDNDPVCKHDPWRKLHFCTHVCLHFVRMCPDDLVGDCGEKDIILDESPYSERLLRCKLGLGDKYVSRGFRDNEIFIWRPRERGLFKLDQLVSSVGFAVGQ